MTNDTPSDHATKIAVVGAGAVGGLLACLLSKLPRDRVKLSVLARGENLAAITDRGLRLQGWDHPDNDSDGQLVCKNLTCVESSPEAARELGVQNYVILALKSHGVGPALPTIQPLLGDHTAVLTIQNGIPFWYSFRSGVPDEIIAKIDFTPVDPGSKAMDIIKPERVIGGVARVAVEVPEAGVVKTYVPWARLTIGESDNSLSPRLQLLADLMQESGVTVLVTSDIRQDIWTKLMGNAFFNPMTALSLMTWAQVAHDEQALEMAQGVMREVWKVATAAGVDMTHTDPVKHIEGFKLTKITSFKSSMHQDLERGRQMEIEALLTVPINIATALEVDTPLLRMLQVLLGMRSKTRSLEDIQVA